MSDYLDPNNEELLKDFFAEAEMQVEVLEQNILVLEQDGKNQDSIDEIFRAAHTLKGAAATVQMNDLAGFTHVLEDVLDDIRSGKLLVNGDIVDLLLSSIDVIKGMLGAKYEKKEYKKDISGIQNSLKNLLNKENSKTSQTEKKVPEKKTVQAPVAEASSVDISEYELLELKETADGNPIFLAKVSFDENNPMNTVGGIQVFAACKDIGSILKTKPDFEKLYEDNFYPVVEYFLASTRAKDEIEKALFISDVTLGVEVQEISLAAKVNAAPAPQKEEQTVSSKPVPKAEPAKALEAAEKAEDVSKAVEETVTREIENKKTNTGGSILRVESRRIDELLNLVSETVINKATFNQVNNLFTDLLNNFANVQGEYRKNIKELFDALPEYLESIQKGGSVKDIRREISERFSGIVTMHDPLLSSMKTTIGKFKSTAQNLGRITSELQEGVMRIRMVPISQIFSRFPRLVRDLSKQLSKDINLRIEGEETELDKSVIEDLLDPLIHCVRNSIDHGIESPEERKKNGKSQRGEVLLKASNEGNMILIEIADDGKGIDVESVRKKAIDRGLIHPNKALTDVEAFSMIFNPGFSTAKQITNISGRGVGLDVVKKQIEKLNGSVSVQSERNKGSRFIIKIPLTLAIIQGLLVRVGTEVYAIPITAVLDSHRIKPSDIRMIDNYEVFNVRDDVVSLMRLNRLFRIPSDEKRDHYFVVIVGSGDKKVGLIVDALIGEEDVVIKPLRDHYTNAPGIAGANITGNGTVSLIIDVSQLLELGQRRELEARKVRDSNLR